MLETLCCMSHWWQDLMMIVNLNCQSAFLDFHPTILFLRYMYWASLSPQLWVKHLFCFLLNWVFKLVLCFIFSSNMQAVMFMTCWQCSQSTWICHQFCTCWTWFPSCLQWLTHDRLFTLLQFWSELSGRQDYPLLLLSLVHLPTQTALFMGQWLLVSDTGISCLLVMSINKLFSITSLVQNATCCNSWRSVCR